MSSELFVRGMLYVSLTVIGVPGNLAVIMAFLLLLYRESHLLAADAIVLHLACANLLVVGVRCLLETLESFYLTEVFTDVGCKAVIFVYRTSRSLSIWLTFVLSTYQCLSIAPPGSRWSSLRALFANQNNSAQHGINVQFCYVYFPSKLSKEANGAAQVGRDVVPMVLMTLASLIILMFLYKHSQQVKGLRGGSGGGVGAEQRAAKAVVALVTLYVVLYGPLVIIASNRKVQGQLKCLRIEKTIVEKATTLSTM
ncbi:hypothetical protein WMY93_012754 [Mugilogobius chulae]|uniref:Vomeronasal type-1 receptor n=1 Tax=Mugilogobius chulae TaxID=88201 RepID=A0AAW0NYE9_9GOBI